MNAVAAMRAAGHPVRRRLLTLLADGEESTPATLGAGVAGASLGTVSYHVQVLADAELVALTRTVERRGLTEHFYRLTPAGRTVLEAADALDQTLDQPS